MSATRFQDLAQQYPPALRNNVFGRNTKRMGQQQRRQTPALPPEWQPKKSAMSRTMSSINDPPPDHPRGMHEDRTGWMTSHPKWSSIHRQGHHPPPLKGKRLYGEEAEALMQDFGNALLMRYDDVKTAFRAIDLNGNGSISGFEFHANTKKWYKGDGTAVFKVLDEARNGVISLEEFQNWNRRQPMSMSDLKKERMRLSAAVAELKGSSSAVELGQ